MDSSLPDRGGVVLVVVDLQEKFKPHIFEWDRVLENTVKAIKGFRVLNLPIVFTEQYPKGLGETVSEIREAAGEFDPIEKTCFDCAGSSEFLEKLKATGAKDVVLCGIEAHVCVLQTALSLLKEGYRVHLLVDAVSSRKQIDCETVLKKMLFSGVQPATVEMNDRRLKAAVSI